MRNNVFTEEFNKIPLSANDDKRTESINEPNEAQYQYLIKKRGNNGLKNLKDP